MVNKFFYCSALLFVVAFVGVGAEPEKVQAPKAVVAEDKVADEYLQNNSVTIRAGNYSGSGIMVQTKDDTWVWTAAHVIKPLRETRSVVDDSGATKIRVEFADAKVLRFRKDNVEGRIVGSGSSDAEVIRYSDAEFGLDLCLLRLRDKEFKPLDGRGAVFYLDKKLPPIGADLYHCGSLLGPMGSNSLTTGIISQHGRVFDNHIYDQTSCTAFPGSSGGPVVLKKDGRYVGMLVMGAGESFNLIVPTRRIAKWAKEVGVEFAVDTTVAVPTDKVLYSKPVEGASNGGGGRDCCKQRIAANLKYMIQDERDPLARTGTTLSQWFARPGLIWQLQE